MSSMLASAKKFGTESAFLYWELLKAMVPVMILVRIGVEMGLLDTLAALFGPVMDLVGLPAATGLVWASAILVNPYAAAATLVGILPYTSLSVADLTVLASMILVAHSIPVEQAISRKAGISFLFSSSLRLGGAMLYGWILSLIYDAGEWLQDPVVIAWLPGDGAGHETWGVWTLNSLISLFWLFWIVFGLLILLKFLEYIKVTDLLAKVLAPMLGLMGISKKATSITMVGVMLGLGFGGGLIIKEARAGMLPPRDIVLSLSFMALCHSLIEDPLFMMALGADVMGVLIGRFIFAVLAMMVLSRLILALPDAWFDELLYRPAT